VFVHEDDFYTREYCPEANRIILKSDTEKIVIEDGAWTCWGVVMLSLNPLLQPQHRMGRYAGVCAC
jgi:DNA polymerase V